ncbi:MAG: ATP-binding cassette domain-containing protein [Elusimicrobia bacterium]|nr:ATP-binding cassette domain-containing protein [Elusimicrobiota bacterium]
MNAIALDGIRKSYFGKRVLDEISLQLAHGHFYALLGRNGAGKSTLMRVIGRQEAPDAGRGTVMGFDVEDDPEDFFRVVAYSSESVDFSVVGGPIGRLIRQLRLLYPAWDQERFDLCVADFGVDLDVQFGSMSRGQRVQALLAFTLSTGAKLLLLDEVTAALDARARALAVRLCKQFVDRGGTVMMATNLVSEVHPAADTMIYLESGAIRLVSPVEEISSRFVKLRRPEGNSHAVFERDDCLELRLADDGARLYLVPAASVTPAIPGELRYPGRATAEDVFVYFTHKGAETRL